MSNAPHLSTPVNPSVLYRAPECARIFGVSRSTWWHWAKTGRAARGIKLGPRTTVWEGSYLLELKQKLIAESQN